VDGQQENLRVLLTDEEQQPFATLEDRRKLIDALGEVKILDPACGSGAYPMGALQVMVKALRKLDPDNELWKQRQIDEAQQISDPAIRADLIDNIEAAFAANEPDYGRKLYLIENCIYGVDIQPIAAQISKLRFFIALMVDQVVDPDKENFGVRALPNLETKLVAANTLFKLDHDALTSDRVRELEAELADIRHRHFAAKTAKTKAKYREKDRVTREALAMALEGLGMPPGAADAMAGWDPYDQNTSAVFFDADWMFNLRGGFDIVIGNPPYLRIQGIRASNPDLVKYLNKTYESSTGSYDLYVVFTEASYGLVKPRSGVLNFIMPDKWLISGFGRGFRGWLTSTESFKKLVSFGDNQFFKAVTYSSVIWLRGGGSEIEFIDLRSVEIDNETDFDNALRRHVSIPDTDLLNGEQPWVIIDRAESGLIRKLQPSVEASLGDHVSIDVGVQTSLDAFYILHGCKISGGYIEGTSNIAGCTVRVEREACRKILLGKKLPRGRLPEISTYALFPYRIEGDTGSAELIPEDQLTVWPLAFQYYKQHELALRSREKTSFDDESWHRYGRHQGFKSLGHCRVLVPDLCLGGAGIFDEEGLCLHSTTIYSYRFKEEAGREMYLYLYCLLVSSLLWYYVTRHGSVQRGGYYRYKTKIIAPFRFINPEDEQLRKICKLAEKALGVCGVQKNINQFFIQLYGLEEEEAKIVDRSLERLSI